MHYSLCSKFIIKFGGSLELLWDHCIGHSIQSKLKTLGNALLFRSLHYPNDSRLETRAPLTGLKINVFSFEGPTAHTLPHLYIGVGRRVAMGTGAPPMWNHLPTPLLKGAFTKKLTTVSIIVTLRLRPSRILLKTSEFCSENPCIMVRSLSPLAS